MGTSALDTPHTGHVRSARQAFTFESLKQRLLPVVAPGGPLMWIVPLVVTAIAGLLRMVNLAHPHLLIFDETYYVKDAFAMLQSGYEREWADDSDEQFIAGNPQLENESSFVVHPPLGKWMIGVGMLLFGDFNGFGWRFSTALIGTLSVLLVTLCARLLFGSHLLAGIAGLLMAIDGHSIVMSRTALLDIFLMFFVLAAFYALLKDRIHGRTALARKLSVPDGNRPDDFLLMHGPMLWWRPWRLIAAIMLGGAVGIKWSALSFVAVFCLMAVLWDFGARRTAGIHKWQSAAFIRDGVYSFFTMMPLVLLTYLSTWTGWLVTQGGRYRHWAEENPGEGISWLPAPLRSLWHYHQAGYEFHTGLNSEHGWQSSPWTWPFAGRPVLFYFEGYDKGVNGCELDRCTEVITDLPNPLMWWACTISMFLLILWWIGARDWRAGAILSSVAAGFLPWLMYPERTMFFFYTLPLVPFMVLALTYMIGRFIPRHPNSGAVYRSRVIAVTAFMALLLVTSAFFWPIWSGEMIADDYWRLHVWLPSWG
ncbi:dolichyl-phosphate-mannose--protein mannosyltransferase [Glutamicibacter nicotianae]|uniref:dolichyl-phosphate-mannose--protein mannosyltransferase n=1 Tax=Glutamicibacter nicotianae TaxID=37929 RepID=UPI002555B65A|nr:phospholipid carrier-dependent glycosyltransferase [Glutamicibacter nicotianae]WIV45643.1 phospholipid carrier-dependent glycosyltransferase [Glutamicibacter nicotianae]